VTSGGRLRVAVVQGGPSNEAEVSRASAKGVAAALEEAGHAAVCLELDARLAEALRTGGFDVVFPITHGAVGEDGSLQGLLEVLSLAYVGSGVLASALAMDKGVARRVLASHGLPVARGVEVARPSGPSDPAKARAAAERARAELGARVVVKPSSGGSAIGVGRFDEKAPIEEIARAVGTAWEMGASVLVEHFARGREVTCAVLDAAAHGPAVAFPPTEIVSPGDAFYTYEAKYAPGRSVHTCPARLEPAAFESVQRIALLAHGVLGCRDLSRVDFIVGDDDDAQAITLLEVNTLPGMTATSLYPEAALVAGLPFPTLCDLLVRTARDRGPTPRVAARPLPA
jgi:D-alanine-D-alanine ligase